MEINIKDYLPEDEIKEIASEQVRTSVRLQLDKEKDITRVITNASYDIVYKMVDAAIDEDLADFISLQDSNSSL